MTDDVKLDGSNLLENESITLDDALDAFKANAPVIRRIPVDGMARYDLEVQAQLVPRATPVPAPDQVVAAATATAIT